MKIAFVGASGYGNVGDDTYPLVFAQRLAGHDLLFYNSDLPDQLPPDLDLLVIGGGGVLYNVSTESGALESPHFRCMKFYMDAAIALGIPWGILSCGFQFRGGYDAEALADLRPWAPYLQQAHFITLRSPSCVRIAAEVSGRDTVAQFFPDAAYLFKPALVEPWHPGQGSGRVTLVPAGYCNPRNALVTHHLRQLVSCGLSVTWLGMGAPVDDDSLLAYALTYFPKAEIIANPSPAVAFERIATSRMVITGRYHGMVFARSSGVPFITPMDVPYKITVEDFSAPTTSAEGHFQVLQRFIT